MSSIKPTSLGLFTESLNDQSKANRFRQQKITSRLVKQLSQESLQMGPDHITLEVKDEQTGHDVKKKVYVTEVSGYKTLDLYSGWDPDSGQHKQLLKHLPPKVCTLSNLQRLWLSHNSLSNLPPQLSQLVHLKELYLHRNNFSEFPISVCSLSSLEILWLNCNKIMSVPDEIAQMSSLKRLHLDNNFIKVVTSSLCLLVNLEVLYLNDNTIHDLSDDIGNLTNLKRLYLQKNKLSELPSGLCQLKALKMLYLDCNEIRHFKKDFLHFQSEQVSKGSILSFENNPIMTSQGGKMKSTLHAPHGAMKTRRFSDQHDADLMAKRPLRISLPSAHHSDSVPANMHRLEHQFQLAQPFKADTLPRRKTIAALFNGATYNED